MKLRVVARFIISGDEFFKRMHQRLRHELAAIGPEVAARIRHLI